MHSSAIYSLATQLFQEHEWPAISHALTNADPMYSRTFFEEDELAAFILVSRHNNIAFIDFCGVNPKYQGKGLGSKLLKETLSGIFQADFCACRLIVDAWNKDAKRLYERLGFQQIAVVEQKHDAGYLLEMKGADWISRK
jgi:ribosomal protein S18 acetylase RimI-like enzyme